jgi:hypothetical protein
VPEQRQDAPEVPFSSEVLSKRNVK